MESGKTGVGIGGMRERLRQLGGVVEIRSTGNGKGTIVFAQVPVGRPAVKDTPQNQE